MFVTTFYSYKGGVGRTMALANVAAELSRRGKSVLIADFDLEAPGVSTIPFSSANGEVKQSPGIVDYIHYWLENDRAPDVSNYVMKYEPTEGGPIWIMPAGSQDGSYGSRLSEIDWSDLYEKREGYLVLEDLKKQWKTVFNPDYVLIDSRTGHTDVGGICTRQLPNLVVFVFWPNIQNLKGLELITAEMTAQSRTQTKKIERLFVPSNLPTIDDEEELLKEALNEFRRRLRYDQSEEIQIHNYQSIDFLKQLLFTTKRPKTSIAQEYRALAEAIMSFNLGDEDGIKLKLTKLLDRNGLGAARRAKANRAAATQALDIDNQFFEYADLLRDWKDPKIHGLVASYFERLQKVDLSILELQKAIRKDPSNLDLNFQLAKLLARSTDSSERADAPKVVESIVFDESAKPTQLAAALNLYSSISEAMSIDRIEEAPAFQKLSENGWRQALGPLRRRRHDTRIAARLLKRAFQRSGNNWTATEAINDLSLIVIAGGEFALATEMLFKANIGVQTDFNMVIAKWGMTREIPQADFEKVLQSMSQTESRHGDLNFEQCWALALMALDRKNEAELHLEKAKAALGDGSYSISCWSYLERGPIEFKDDLISMEQQLAMGKLLPSVFADSW